MGCLLEDTEDVFFFSAGIAEAELAEYPFLKGDGTLLAFFLQLVYVIQSEAKDLGSIHVLLRCVLEILPPFGRLNDSNGIINL